MILPYKPSILGILIYGNIHIFDLLMPIIFPE